MNHDPFPAAIDAASFATEVLGAPGPVVVDVSAAWCTPCRMLAALLPRLAREFGGHLAVRTLDADAHGALCEEWDVPSYPHLLLFHAGTLRGRIAGFPGYAALHAGLAAFLADAAGHVAIPGPGEAAFRRAAEAAERAYEDATVPAAEAVGRVLEPHFPAYEREMAELRCDAGSCTVAPDERARRMKAANERLTALAAPELAEQRVVTATALAAYAEAIAAATRLPQR